jgi:hypothetical protein
VSASFKCTTGAKVHQNLPRTFAADFPDMYASMNREARLLSSSRLVSPKRGLPNLLSLQPIYSSLPHLSHNNSAPFPFP